jgi:MYXO-CTERM domain-containing protein
MGRVNRIETAVLAAAMLAGCATERPVERRSGEHGRMEAPIYFGQASDAPWVVAVTYLRPSTGRLRLCTGSVIAPDAVLTAKHCVFDEDPEDVWSPVDLDAFTVFVTDDVRDQQAAEQALGVVEIWTTPDDYESAQALGGEDIAVLRVDGQLTPAPVPWATRAPTEGETVRIFGFGFDQDDVLGVQNVADVRIRAFDDRVFESEGDAWTCTGDSGGPAIDPATGEVLGVTSTGPSGCQVDDSYYTRVDRHAEAIAAFLGVEPEPEADAGADPEPALDAGGEPEPQVDAGAGPAPDGGGDPGAQPGPQPGEDAGAGDGDGAGDEAGGENAGGDDAGGDDGGCDVAATDTAPGAIAAWALLLAGLRRRRGRVA